MAMMADAISHAILPGLVAGYVLANGPNVLAGFFGATAAGLLTVWLVESLTRSRRVKEDTAIGLIFPALFALGVVIISKFFANVHLDTDAVLFGEIAFAPLETWSINGHNLGPSALWTLSSLTLLNALFLGLFYKELKLSTFDSGLAAALGFAPTLLHYALMGMVAVTTVGGFTAVGAILVIALLIVPPVTASLLTHRLPFLIGLSVGIGVVGALVGFWLAKIWDVSISGMIATVHGGIFGLTLLFAPSQGLVAQTLRRRRQGWDFRQQMLVVHLASHEGTAVEDRECRPEHLVNELGWSDVEAQEIVRRARANDLVNELDAEGHIHLTPTGKALAEQTAQIGAVCD
jgi:manganese/zinc/iron transport system permease protein